MCVFVFFFNDTATTEIYTLSLHDALPIYLGLPYGFASHFAPAALEEAVALYRRSFRPSKQLQAPYVIAGVNVVAADTREQADRKSTRLNSSHANISYAVFCLKKKHELTCS